MPESTPDLLPTLVKLMESAVKIVGTDLKAAAKWVKASQTSDATVLPTATAGSQVEVKLYKYMRVAAKSALTGSGEVMLNA